MVYLTNYWQFICKTREIQKGDVIPSVSELHFLIFQLNSLDLNGDTKNIFWHQPVMEEFFGTCVYVSAVPNFQVYNHNVFNKLLAIFAKHMKYKKQMLFLQFQSCIS